MFSACPVTMRPKSTARQSTNATCEELLIPKQEQVEDQVIVMENDNQQAHTPTFTVPRDMWNFKQSIHAYCRLSSLDVIKSRLTSRQLEEFKKGCFGYLLEINEIQFQHRLIHQLVRRQTEGTTDNELYFLIGERIVKFDKKDFALMTGLNCGPVPIKDWSKTRESGLKKKYFGNKNGAIKVSDLIFVFKNCANDDDDIIKLAKLYMVEKFIAAKQDHHHVENHYFYMLDEVVEFERHPWGTISFNQTLKYFKNAKKLHSTAYGMGGCPYAIMVWAFETIPILEEKKYAIKIARGLPRLLNWQSKDLVGWNNLNLHIFECKQVKVVGMNITNEEWSSDYMAPFRHLRPVAQHTFEETQLEDVVVQQSTATNVSSENIHDSSIHNEGLLKKLLYETQKIKKKQDELDKKVEMILSILYTQNPSVVASQHNEESESEHTKTTDWTEDTNNAASMEENDQNMLVIDPSEGPNNGDKSSRNQDELDNTDDPTKDVEATPSKKRKKAFH